MQIPADNTTTAVLPLSGNITGWIDTFGDRDWYRLSLRENQVVTIDMEGTDTSDGTLSDPYLRLWDPTGLVLLETNDDKDSSTLNSQIIFTAQETATYFVSAAAFLDAYQGSYTLTAFASDWQDDDDIPGNTTTGVTLVFDVPVSSAIAPSGDEDWFRLPLSAGQGIRIDLDGLETAFGPLDVALRLYDPSGTQLLEQNDNREAGTKDSRIDFTAERSGTYFVVARTPSDFGDGNYTLTVRQTSQDPGPIPDDPNAVVWDFHENSNNWQVREFVSDEWTTSDVNFRTRYIFDGEFLRAVYDKEQSEVWSFTGPREFSGDKADFYGGSISLDLRYQDLVEGEIGLGPAIELYGSSESKIEYTLAPPLDESWGTYTADIRNNVGWVDDNGMSATEDLMKFILSDLDRLRITFDSRVETVDLDNVVLTPGPDEPDLDVFRFYNTLTGTHFYTPSVAERDHVRSTLDYFTYEGPSFRAAASGTPGAEEVYRFFNTESGVHFYTINDAERQAVLDDLPEFQDEGIGYYAYETPVEGSIPLFRFFNTSTGTHFYTPSEAERDIVNDTLPEFVDEGIAFYVDPWLG